MVAYRVGFVQDTPDSSQSEFYITRGAAPHLDGNVVAFGTVVTGTIVLEQVHGVRFILFPKTLLSSP